MLFKGGDETVLELPVIARIVQSGFQFRNTGGNGIPLLDCGSLCGKVFRFADFTQRKGFIQSLDLLAEPSMSFPQFREGFFCLCGIFFPFLVLFLP